MITEIPVDSIPLVGPSYTLASRKADIQRSVNMYLQGLEAPSKAPFILSSVPGLVVEYTLSGEARGGLETNDRTFQVCGNTLYELFEGGSSVSRGTLLTTSGKVSLAYGLSQLVIVDGANGYVLTLATNTFIQITASGFPGADTVRFFDNYFVFSRDRQGQQFQISAINDATSVDPLDFASAESSPDDIVGFEVLQAGALFFGTLTAELFVDAPSTDFQFQRSQGSGFRVGLTACHSLCEVDNGCMWIGRDKQGAGIVFRLTGGQPQRVSTQAVEQKLQGSTDLTQAVAFAYQDQGLTFYCIQAPGLETTWCFEVSTGSWHERADLADDGSFKQWRPLSCFFGLGKHLMGDANGVIYSLDHDSYTYGADPIVRKRVSPHDAVAGRVSQFFSEMFLDVETGGAPQGVDPQVELSWSDDSGKSWSNPILRSLGKTGEIFPRLRWTRLGRSRDRVWDITFRDNAPFTIVSGSATSIKGLN